MTGFEGLPPAYIETAEFDCLHDDGILYAELLRNMGIEVVLNVLWKLAAVQNISYLSVIICFLMFLVNDLYGFINWKRMEKRQMATV